MSFRSSLVSQFKKPQGLFGRLAGITMALRPSNRQRNRWTIDLLGLDPTDTVLEIGYGPGLAAKWAARKLKRGHITGIDHSQTMLNQASRRNQKFIRKGRMTLLHGDVGTLPEGAGPFDKIYSANVAQFWDDQEATFKVLRMRMKSGGTIATTFMPRSKNATRKDAEAFADQMSARIEAAGFTGVHPKWLETTPVPAVCILATA